MAYILFLLDVVTNFFGKKQECRVATAENVHLFL